MAGLRLPIESHVLQAFVSEGIKPIVPSVITFGAGHFYISQSDKGGLVFGGNIDGFTRTMTTALALETSKGDLPLALAPLASSSRGCKRCRGCELS